MTELELLNTISWQLVVVCGLLGLIAGLLWNRT